MRGVLSWRLRGMQKNGPRMIILSIGMVTNHELWPLKSPYHERCLSSLCVDRGNGAGGEFNGHALWICEHVRENLFLA